MKWFLLTAVLLCGGCQIVSPPIPALQKHSDATQLMVDGKPYLILGGELHNSSATSLDYMHDVWPRLTAMHMNTVLAAVTWEQVQPAEGQFDFRIVDGLLEQARDHHLRLVLLWFGSWKNGTSRYTPAWVKADPGRFPLVVNKDGNALEILSAFSENNCQADSAAYAALLRHLREIDSRDRTVIMIQLENEVGVLGDSRDRRPEAEAAFKQAVPSELLDYLHAHSDRKFQGQGNWQDVFGPGSGTDEIFMAWNYARYINRVAAAGKAEYALPVYINTWIVQPQDKGPGDYPSGGAVAQVHDIWRAAGSAVDMLCPDIYLPDFAGIVKAYCQPGYGFFIPESRGGAAGAANSFYVIGQWNSIGFSPFGIDAGEADNGPLTRAYNALSELAPEIAAHQGDGSMTAVLLNANSPSQPVSLGDYTLHVELRRTRFSPTVPAQGFAILINTAPNQYTIAGSDVQITFTPNTPGPAVVGLAKVQEDLYTGGRWVPGRWLNGDEVQLRYDLSPAAAEKLSGSGVRLNADGPYIQNVWLYRYP